MSNLLYNSLLNSDFLILSDSNKINNNLIIKNIKLQNNNLQILDSFSILKSIKQMIKIIEILKKSSKKVVIHIILTSNSQFYFLLKLFFAKNDIKNLEIKIENSLNFKNRFHGKDSSTSLIINLNDFSKKSENFLLFKHLLSQKIYLLFKINSTKEFNFLGSYKIHNDILNFKKLLFLIILLKYITTEKK